MPYGENNAATWLGRGSNLEWQGGFYARYDHFTLNFRPQVAWQENRAFIVPRYVTRWRRTGRPPTGRSTAASSTAPTALDPNPFWTFDWGHTSLRADYGNLSAGFSTEPMWWGPAVRYPLVMSNNAPGFPRLHLGTRGPVGVPYIGTVEFTWTVGWPQDSKWFKYPNPYHRQQRLFNGFNLTWSPSFAPGLYLGWTRAYHQFVSEGSLFSNLFAIYDPTQKDVLVTRGG
ncbi:MAG: capsule assembly Wzi family protein [Balneolaceae bacterium]|nr:capsule assembly Wzi family protein [Balneolaceae bacterium]